MLAKLIKHEWKAVAKLLLIIHIALFGMAVIGKLLLSIKPLQEVSVLWTMLLFVYIISTIAVGIGTHIFLAVRFYKNMYTDEGYLSFTLPVKPWEHLFAKLFVAITWIIIDLAVILGSVLILNMHKGLGGEIEGAMTGLGTTVTFLGMPPVLFGIQLVITGFLSLIMTVLMYYFSISIGQLAKTHKLVASVVTFVVTFNLVRIVTTLIDVVAMVIMTAMGENIESMSGVTAFYGKVMGVTVVEILVLSVIFWCVCNYIMSKKLNLE